MISSYIFAKKKSQMCAYLDLIVSASENKVKEKASVPRVIIVAVVLGIILVVIVKVSLYLCYHYLAFLKSFPKYMTEKLFELKSC